MPKIVQQTLNFGHIQHFRTKFRLERFLGILDNTIKTKKGCAMLDKSKQTKNYLIIYI